jgi:hypothetical protein
VAYVKSESSAVAAVARAFGQSAALLPQLLETLPALAPVYLTAC